MSCNTFCRSLESLVIRDALICSLSSTVFLSFSVASVPSPYYYLQTCQLLPPSCCTPAPWVPLQLLQPRAYAVQSSIRVVLGPLFIITHCSCGRWWSLLAVSLLRRFRCVPRSLLRCCCPAHPHHTIALSATFSVVALWLPFGVRSAAWDHCGGSWTQVLSDRCSLFTLHCARC